MAGGEREFVRRLQGLDRASRADVLLGIGDDMAILRAGESSILVTSDMLLDGVHFDSSTHTPAQIGRKAAACSLSDCAAMAVRPVAAVVSVALPRAYGVDKAQALMEGIAGACAEFDCALVGGDTTSWPHPLALDVAMLARPYDGVSPVRRDGARMGDGVYVTGSLGGSLLGKHLTFTPKVREARAIAESLGPKLHAMMDVTDGLAIDLDRMIESSGVGAVLDEGAVLSIADAAAVRLAQASGRPVLDHVLHDGEDFELLLAGEVEAAGAECHLLTRVGEIVAPKGLRLRRADGTIVPLEPRGYEHL
jgi:thiamine-monophosphate kinase